MARCARAGSLPASHAITASTANSGSVWSQARIASANPCEMRNCAASAPQATRNADSSMLGKVHSAASAVPPAWNASASTFRDRTGVQVTMARDKMKSASLRSFHEEHTAPTEIRIPFQTLVPEMLEQLGEDPTREGLRQTPARVEASLEWLTRGYHMADADVIGAPLFRGRHEYLGLVQQ